MSSDSKQASTRQAIEDARVFSAFKPEIQKNGFPARDSVVRFICSLLSAQGHPLFLEDDFSGLAVQRYLAALLYRTFESPRLIELFEKYDDPDSNPEPFEILLDLACAATPILRLADCKVDGLDIRGIIARGAEKALDASVSGTLADLPGQLDLFAALEAEQEEDTAMDAIADMIAYNAGTEGAIRKKLVLLADAICERDALESAKPGFSFLPEGGTLCHPDLLDPRMSPQAREAWARHGGAFLRALFAGDGAQWELFGNPAAASLKKRGRGRPQKPRKG